MDKFEYKLKSTEIDNLFEAGDYKGAMNIADEIDWRRVGSIESLRKVSNIYAINRRYDDAINLLKMAAERYPSVKEIYYSLTELYLKKNDLVTALECLKQYKELNPDVFSKSVLQYKCFAYMGASIDEQIALLEKACEADYTERWAYELAKLYDKAGYEEKCVDECDQIAAWFGNGRFVSGALELKKKYVELTPKQNDVLNKVNEPEPVVAEKSGDTKVFTAEDIEAIKAASEEENLVATVDVSEFNTINLQAEIAKEFNKILDDEDPVKVKLTESADNTTVISAEEIKQIVRGEDVKKDEAPEDADKPEEELTVEAEETEPAIAEESEEPEVEAEVETEPAEEAVEPESDVKELFVKDEPANDADDSEEINAKLGAVGLAFPPSEMSKTMSQEGDGQISFIYPESDTEENQIPGQMNLDDIMREWERMKKEAHNRQTKQVTSFITRQTDKMFSEFEESVRDSLLDKIERGEVEVSQIDEAANKELFAPQEEEAVEEPEIVEEETEELVEEPEVVEEEIEEPSEESEVAEDETEELAEEPEEVPEESDYPVEISDEEIAEEAAETEELEAEPEEAPAEEEEPVSEPEETEEAAEAEEEPAEEPKEETKVAAPELRLSDELEKNFVEFLHSDADRTSLTKVLDTMSLASYTGNVILTGDDSLETISLAKKLIAEFKSREADFNGKVAKITGRALNDKKIDEVFSERMNGAVIIQKASGMSDEIIKDIIKWIEMESKAILLVIEDNETSMRRLLENHPNLKKCFNARMKVSVLNSSTLAEYGVAYAKEKEFAIDEMGLLALHSKIAELQRPDSVVGKADVEAIVDAAIDRAKRISLGHFFRIIGAKRYDSEDMIIISEKDFK